MGRLRKKHCMKKEEWNALLAAVDNFPPAVSGNAAFSEDAKVDLVQNNNSQALRNPHWVIHESAKFLQGKNPRHFLIFLQPYLSFLLSLEAFFCSSVLPALPKKKIEFVGGGSHCTVGRCVSGALDFLSPCSLRR